MSRLADRTPLPLRSLPSTLMPHPCHELEDLSSPSQQLMLVGVTFRGSALRFSGAKEEDELTI